MSYCIGNQRSCYLWLGMVWSLHVYNSSIHDQLYLWFCNQSNFTVFNYHIFQIRPAPQLYSCFNSYIFFIPSILSDVKFLYEVYSTLGGCNYILWLIQTDWLEIFLLISHSWESMVLCMRGEITTPSVHLHMKHTGPLGQSLQSGNMKISRSKAGCFISNSWDCLQDHGRQFPQLFYRIWH